jgi:ankyrin repeat protein
LYRKFCPLSEEKPNPAALNQIRKFCGSLIREAADGKQLEPAHFTVQEFFNSITQDSHPHIAQFCLSKNEPYLELTKVSLTYLNFKDFHKPIPPFNNLLDPFEDHAFYGHVADFWVRYAENYWADENVLRLGKQLFKPPMSTNFKLWGNRFILGADNGDELMERIISFGDSLLHWAAYLSIHQLIEWLVSNGQDADAAGALGTPLSAAMRSNTKASGCSIEAPPYSTYRISLLCNQLSEEGVQTCVKTLISKGARTEHIFECEIGGKNYDLSSREVLLYAVDIQVLEMEYFPVEFFDEHVVARMKIVIKDIEDEIDDYPLREEMVRMLRRMKRAYIVPEFRLAFDGYVEELQDDIEVDYDAMVDIWAAAQNGQADVLKSLLEERVGIKINDQDDLSDDSSVNEDDEESYDAGKNALHFAASAGSYECIHVLMDAGASVHITTNSGNTAFHFAAGSLKIGARQCVDMLLDAGISLNAKNHEDWTALHFAALSGHPKNVEFLLEKGFDPHLADSSGRTTYHLAVSNYSDGVLKLLLEHRNGGISGMHVKDADGFKPAQLAVFEDNRDFVRKLLKHIDMKELAFEEEPFLLFVAREGSAGMMKVVLCSNPDIFVRGNDQSTILHAIAENHCNFQEIISNVIQLGVPRSDVRNDGSMPLHLLLSGLQPIRRELLEMMIEGNPNAVDGKQNNYLMCLSRSDRPASQNEDIALDLIKLGVNALQRNNKGESFYYQCTKTDPASALKTTPHINDLKGMDKVHWRLSGWLTIHFAIIKGDLSLVNSLLEKGSYFEKETKDTEFNVAGRKFFRDRLNCMHVAALYGQKQILECILGVSNLPIDCRDGDGVTALHLAALHGSDDCVKLLLSKGADEKIQDSQGESVLHYAIKSKALSVIQMLIEARTPLVPDQKGDTPVGLAMGEKNHHIAELLRKYQTLKNDDRDNSLSNADEILEVDSLDLPFRFGSRSDHYDFEFNCLLGTDARTTSHSSERRASRRLRSS